MTKIDLIQNRENLAIAKIKNNVLTGWSNTAERKGYMEGYTISGAVDEATRDNRVPIYDAIKKLIATIMRKRRIVASVLFAKKGKNWLEFPSWPWWLNYIEEEKTSML